MDTLRTAIQDRIPGGVARWLVTGAAGFIGSNLVETLLKLDQEVVGIDNYSTGHKKNLDEVWGKVSPAQWGRFAMHTGDIRSAKDCSAAVDGVDFVLHQAALGSVPRSIEDPVLTNENNVDGFLNMLVASRDAGAKSFVYAASSSTYGDHPGLPKVEDQIGRPLSPYAVTKYVNELYAEVFASCYGFRATGLRYFNIFGPRQDPDGAYAAVIPCWFAALLHGDPPRINGDGLTSRDFCYVDNAVQANILAACSRNGAARGQVYNVAFAERTTLNDLFVMIRDIVARVRPSAENILPEYGPERPGDVKHSLADISRARSLIGYAPTHSIRQGLEKAAEWYVHALA